MEENIKNITIGIRFVRTFHLTEISGKITDDALRNKKSPFKKDFFKFVDRDREGGRILHCGKSNDTALIINKDDIIFSLDIDDFEEGFKKIQETYLPYIIDGIIKENKLTRIQRLGVIFRHSLEDKVFADKIIKLISDNKIDSPNDLMLRFSKKDTTMQGHAIRGKDDYKNTIFTFEYDNEKLFIDIDCQHYFHPIVEDIIDTKPNDFLDFAKIHIEKQYKWLENVKD